MLTPSQAESWFKKSPAEQVTKLSKAVQKAINHLEQKQIQQKGKALETDYLLQRLRQDKEDLKPEMRQKSGTDIDKDKREAIAKRVRKAYTLHSRSKRLVYNAAESSDRKIAPVLGKKAPARTNIQGAIDAERANLARQAEAAKQRAKSEEGDQAQSSTSANATTTPEPEAEQGVMASAVAYIGSWMPGAYTGTPAPKQETTTKQENKAEAPPQQPPSSTSEKPENAETPETQDLHEQKTSGSDTAVVEADNPAQEDDAASSKPAESTQQQTWADWLLGRS